MLNYKTFFGQRIFLTRKSNSGKLFFNFAILPKSDFFLNVYGPAFLNLEVVPFFLDSNIQHAFTIQNIESQTLNNYRLSQTTLSVHLGNKESLK